jgi:hypothetical protein
MMRVPDDREEYPLHLGGDSSKAKYLESKEMTHYFPCRTYDKNGSLIKEESRGPEVHGELDSKKLENVNFLFRRSSSPPKRKGK